MASRFDMIVLGATGFTGKYVVEELNRMFPADASVTWAISGRSQSKLDKVLKDLQEKTGDDLSKITTIIADIGDEQSLTDMSIQAKVLLNCCGPYEQFGEPVVKACIDTKTHYVDITGEPIFMEKMQLKYNEEAKEAGVYIVSACAFDSIPGDMGVVFLQQKFKGTVNMVEEYVRFDVPPKYMRFGEAIFHTATWDSVINATSKMSELSSIRDQIYPEELPAFKPKAKSRWIIHKSKIDDEWYLKLPGVDTTVVNRSQRFFYDNENKRPVHMMAYFGWTTLFPLLLVTLGIIMGAVLSRFSFTRKLLLKYPRLFSLGFVSDEGPREAASSRTRFWFNIYGEGWDESVKDTTKEKPNKSMIVKVSGINPAYGITSTALILSALTIIKESDKMPGTGGVLSPGAAFSKTSLLDNLQKNHIKFEVVKQSSILL